MERQPEDVLAELFDSDDFNPFSDPLGAARLALQHLEKAGYEIKRREPQ